MFEVCSGRKVRTGSDIIASMALIATTVNQDNQSSVVNLRYSSF